MRKTYCWECPDCRNGGFITCDEDEVVQGLAFAKMTHARNSRWCTGIPILNVPIKIAPEEWVAAA